MYQQQDIDPKKKKKTGKFQSLIQQAFSGMHLLRSIEKWGVWAAAIIIIILIALWNEHSINNKEKRNKQLQDKYDSTVVEFKIRNEVIYTDDEEKLREKASEEGFVPTKANNYYKIVVTNE
ncbi:MAG: hypothetical protein IJP72_07485 [Bacteroidales bacterium]|nr:hypothetical protein [Bacteroidales bacterium]